MTFEEKIKKIKEDAEKAKQKEKEEKNKEFVVEQKGNDITLTKINK